MDFDAKLYAARRARVFEEMERRGGGVMILPAADEKPRNADNEYVFRQDSDYAWTVGLDEPMGGAVLLARGGERKLILFVRPRDREKEIWTGRRAGVEGAKEVYRASEAYPVGELDQRLPGLVDGAGTLWFRVGHDAAWDARVGRVLCRRFGRSRARRISATSRSRASSRFCDCVRCSRASMTRTPSSVIRLPAIARSLSRTSSGSEEAFRSKRS